jgi:Tfp pilus assembly protein PilN
MNSFENSDLSDHNAADSRQADRPSTVALTPGQLLLLWLVAGSLFLALIPFGLLSRSIRNDIRFAEAELDQVEAQLDETPSPPPDVQPLLATLETLQGQAEELERTTQTIAESQIYWPALMDTVHQYDPQEIEFTTFIQEERRIILEGKAVNDDAVVAYVQSLDSAEVFSRVLIQSINLINRDGSTVTATPELTVTSTLTPSTTPTLTPTPSLRDAYEVDDFDPVPIFFDQPQLHNFYPVYDIDKVTFLTKAGRYYRVYTTDLRPGVDTVLEVRVGGVSYRNDDRDAGRLSSEVVFQGGSYDADAVVTISNRDEYGPEQQYRVVVEEILPTPTPTVSPLSPTPSPSPTPTPTSTPTPQQPPTPDQRDAFEPDQPLPPTITLGETQRHNFYPEDDVDQLTFLAEAGRIYRVSTSNLTPGVDTVLTVTVGTETYTHDDRSPGDLGSDLIVTVPEDRDYQALVIVENRGAYGPEFYYQISLKQATVTPTPTPTPTPVLSPTATLTTTESSQNLKRPPGLSRPLLRSPLLPANQTFSGPDAVEFVIILDLAVDIP